MLREKTDSQGILEPAWGWGKLLSAGNWRAQRRGVCICICLVQLIDDLSMKQGELKVLSAVLSAGLDQRKKKEAGNEIIASVLGEGIGYGYHRAPWLKSHPVS